MKTFLFLCLSVLLLPVYAQKNDYRIPLQRAKTLFKSERTLSQEQLDKFDYNEIVALLKQSIQLNPKSAEAHYFLGYTYSRMNSRDGRGMINMNLDLLYKTSKAFEQVNRISPKYLGEVIALDPYSKLSAEWGSMAMSYWHNNKPDSAIWAFREGKNRGGFGTYFLELNKQILDACDKDAILISSGDNFSFPLWYLQIAESYRPDVSVIDVSLLNTSWYPAFLAQKNVIRFDQPQAVIDTLDYTAWKDTVITLGSFAWTVKPSYYNNYLLRGDRILLSILNENKFQRPVYFTIGFMEENQLSLTNYLTSLLIVDRVSTSKAKFHSPAFATHATKAIQLAGKVNRNSADEWMMLDFLRYLMIQEVEKYVGNNQMQEAKDLLPLLNQFMDDKKFPSPRAADKKRVELLRTKM